MYRATAPGSLMLFGEHAVLQGSQAVVVAINRYLTVELSPRSDRQIRLFTPAFGRLDFTLEQLSIDKPYEYVLTAIASLKTSMRTGFDLNILADFSSTVGFASSAAVTVAVLAVLNLWLNHNPPDPQQLYQQAVAVVRSVQQVGSGADVAASILGGIVAYGLQPLELKQIGVELPLTVLYSGTKMATPLVIKKVLERSCAYPEVFKEIYCGMAACTRAAITAIQEQAWPRVGQLMDIHQGLQAALGVNNPQLAELIFRLRARKDILGAKISGSGLGDCVVGLGQAEGLVAPGNVQGFQEFKVAVSPTGVVYSKHS